MTTEDRLKTCGIIFPENFKIKTIANYVHSKIYSNQLFISGQLSKDLFALDPKIANFNNPSILTGILGDNCTLEQGQYAAKMCAIQLLYIAKLSLDKLEQIKSCIQLNVFVASNSKFHEHHLVANGASDFICDILGKDIGQHSRVAVGVSSLPLGACVEVSAVFIL